MLSIAIIASNGSMNCFLNMNSKGNKVTRQGFVSNVPFVAIYSLNNAIDSRYVEYGQ